MFTKISNEHAYSCILDQIVRDLFIYSEQGFSISKTCQQSKSDAISCRNFYEFVADDFDDILSQMLKIPINQSIIIENS